MQRRLFQLVIPLIACACTGERWVIGDPLDAGIDAASAFSAAASSCARDPREPMPLPLPPLLLGAEHAGRWRASLSGEEAAKFPASQLVLALGTERAVLRFEAGGSPLPLLNPRGGYLCRAPGAATCATESGLVGDFDYALTGAARGSILSSSLFLEQPWDEWCRAQPPIEQELPGCAPFYDIEAAYSATSWEESCAVQRDDLWFGVDCDRLATLERHPCACDADGCRAAARAQSLNLRLVAPDALEGALWFASDRAQVLHFFRAADAGAP
jgi:hypothetical protein